jgi:hypothetical protein
MSIHTLLLLTFWGTLPIMAAGYQGRPLDSFAARATVEGVTVAAEPYSELKPDARDAAKRDADVKSNAFDTRDLAKRGYFPLYVVIKNETTDYVTLSTRKVVLATGAGETLYTTSAAIMVEDVTRGGGFKGKGGSSELDAMTGKELQNGQIEPGGTVEGLLFFFTSTPRKDFFAGAKLKIPGMASRATGKDVGPFEIPLSAGGPDPKQ